MKKSILINKNSRFYWLAFGFSISIALGLSFFSSPNPDGLERVAKDLKIDHKATTLNNSLAKPLANYKLEGVPKVAETPLAGLIGTLITFSLTWGLSHLMLKKSVNLIANSSEEIS